MWRASVAAWDRYHMSERHLFAAGSRDRQTQPAAQERLGVEVLQRGDAVTVAQSKHTEGRLFSSHPPGCVAE